MMPEQKKTQRVFENPGFVKGETTAPGVTGNSSDISTLIEPYRHELSLHCYRLMGSLHDAEDQVQETMLRAWQRFDTFKGTASLRTWLYAIATHVCLDALKKPQARIMPIDSYAAADPAEPLPAPDLEIPWLEPFPNAWLTEATENPETRYTQRESISFAFLTALQLLPPRQRAILILSDVLDWHAGEVARLLEMSISAVTSALYRARATLTRHYQAKEHARTQVHTDATIEALLKRFVYAWENDDVAGIVELLREDATLSMPPYTSWYAGRESIRELLSATAFSADLEKRWRLRPSGANAQPAFALYRINPSRNCYQAFGILVVTLDRSQPAELIEALTSFHVSSLVMSFGFPPQLS